MHRDSTFPWGRQQPGPRIQITVLTLSVCLLWTLGVSGSPAYAQSGSKVEIHGFGSWTFGDTDGNLYTVGSPDGKYDNVEFALNVSARPMEKLSLVAQIFLESGNDFEGDGDGDDEVELDYAFAEWFFSDALKLRIGRVKHPFGLYGEVFDVGTVRPFQLLPQSIYGPNGFTAKAYNGVGLTGSRTGGTWGLQYDLYAGEIEGAFELPGLLTASSRFLLEPNVELGFSVEDTVGLRLLVSTPVEGLTLGLSAYQGDEHIGRDIVGDETRQTYLFHVEYLTDRWSIRSEVGGLEHENDFEEEGGYLEIAYRLNQHWQLAARAEDWSVDFPNTNLAALPSILPQLMDHEEVAFGINYWISSGAVLRLNYHLAEGNRFAFLGTAEEVAAALASGVLEDETEMLVLGTQFSF